MRWWGSAFIQRSSGHGRPRTRTYLASLSAREAFHVAVIASGDVIGYQSLDLYSPVLSSMAHVGQLGTFLFPDWRRHGVGQPSSTRRCVLPRCRLRKFVIQVRARTRRRKRSISNSASLNAVGFALKRAWMGERTTRSSWSSSSINRPVPAAPSQRDALLLTGLGRRFGRTGDRPRHLDSALETAPEQIFRRSHAVQVCRHRCISRTRIVRVVYAFRQGPKESDPQLIAASVFCRSSVAACKECGEGLFFTRLDGRSLWH